MKVVQLKPGPKDMHFQKYAFDSNLGSLRRNKEFSKITADFGLRELSGFQIEENSPTGPEKEIPDWVYIRKEVQKVLLAAFPRLRTDPNHRKRAGRWAQVIQLYYLQGRTTGQVAQELNETNSSIKNLIIRISRVSKGLTVSGCPRKK